MKIQYTLYFDIMSGSSDYLVGIKQYVLISQYIVSWHVWSDCELLANRRPKIHFSSTVQKRLLSCITVMTNRVGAVPIFKDKMPGNLKFCRFNFGQFFVLFFYRSLNLMECNPLDLWNMVTANHVSALMYVYYSNWGCMVIHWIECKDVKTVSICCNMTCK